MLFAVDVFVSILVSIWMHLEDKLSFGEQHLIAGFNPSFYLDASGSMQSMIKVSFFGLVSILVSIWMHLEAVDNVLIGCGIYVFQS
tara:strand:- start:35 stop:292 length:258 start_codon:yes stop_codon:yes gene_type:complete